MLFYRDFSFRYIAKVLSTFWPAPVGSDGLNLQQAGECRASKREVGAAHVTMPSPRLHSHSGEGATSGSGLERYARVRSSRSAVSGRSPNTASMASP